MTMLADESRQKPVTSLAMLWRLTRTDGIMLGFTNHDATLWLGGLAYRHDPGVTVSAIESEASFDDPGTVLRGLLSGAGVSREDVVRGRWTGAVVDIMLCDWSQPDAGTLLLYRGQVDTVALRGGGGGAFAMGLLRQELALTKTGPLRVSPLCRAKLGDARCAVDTERRWQERRIRMCSGLRVALDVALEDPAAWQGGPFRVMSGALTGLTRQIDGVEDDGGDGAILLLDRPLGDAAMGAVIRLGHGCDKRFETCVARFQNGHAFDGEPHLPGRDALVRYGAA